MSYVQFNDKGCTHTQRKNTPSGTAGFLITKGIVKDVKQANLLMAGFIFVLLVIISITFITSGNSKAVSLKEIPMDQR